MFACKKNLIPVCYLVGMRRRCCRAANYEANQQSQTSFHKASLFWGNDTPFRQAKTEGRNTIQNRLELPVLRYRSWLFDSLA